MAEENKSVPAAEETTAEETAAVTKPKKSGRFRRILKRILVGIGIFLLVVILALLFIRDLIIEHAVEQIGSWAVGTKIEIGYIDTSLFKGKLHLKDLTVDNPQGFHHPHAFELGEIRVALNIKSLFTKKIEVKDIYVSGVNVDYELQLGKSNLGEIQRNLERLEPKKDASADAKSKKDDAEQPQVVIRQLLVENCSLSFSNATLGTTMKLPLPGLDMQDVGDGKPIGETVNDLFGLIFTSITKAVSGVGGVITDAAAGVGGAISEGAKSVTESVKGLVK